jgi:phosphoesterase family protein
MKSSSPVEVLSVTTRFAHRASIFALAVLGLFAGARSALGAPAHVVIVIMENHSFNEIIGSPNAPYINNTLAANGAVLTNHHAVEHPSQPNYLDLFSGSDQGSHDDATLAGTPLSTPNLGALLLAKSLTFTTYSESLPSVGFTGDSFTTVPGQNQYQRKHNPAVNWQSNDAPASNHLDPSLNQPFTAFPTTDVGFSSLPTVSIVVPNEQNDMHDGTVAMGDTWLSNNIEAYRQWAANNNSVLIVTWDEDDSSQSNQIATIVSGQNIRPGNYTESSIETVSGHGTDHFNILRTLENFYGLGICVAAADGSRNPIVDLVRTPLLNIATRDIVATSSQVLIAGFIVTGTDPKPVIIRGIGPSLTGVGATLADPTLELHDVNNTLATNDNWKVDSNGGSQEAAVRATTIPPTNDNESVILATLSPGTYTAILAGKNGGTGNGVVEVYDYAPSSNSRLANISTRGVVNTGDNVLFGGIIVGDGGTSNVVVLALGPSLPLSGTLPDPTLELRDSSGTLIQSNDNWKIRDSDGTSQQAAIQATTVQPSNDAESALVQTLGPGIYTSIVRGKGASTGVGLVAFYNLP